MTDEELNALTKKCDIIMRELKEIREKDYFEMVISCMIDNWSRGFKHDPGKVSMEICQIVNMKEK